MAPETLIKTTLLALLAWFTSSAALAALGGPTHTDATGRIQVDVHFDCALAAPLAALKTAGFSATSTVKEGTLCVVEGWVAPAALTRLSTTAGVMRVTAPSYVLPVRPRTLHPIMRGQVRAPVAKQGASGSIDANGISIIHSAQFIAQTGVTGAGITVGVQSSGVTSLSLIQSRGELPANVTVLYPAGDPSPQVGDEGTVLLEQIYAIAPDAKLIYCGPSTFVDYVSCMAQLIAAGANIVLDDNGFASDGVMSQDNDQSSAVTQLLAQNPSTMMFSAAGNNGGTYWEGSYAPLAAPSTLSPLSCATGSGTPDAYVASFAGATSQTLTVTGGYATFPLLLAWGDPATQPTSQFDVFWFATGSTTQIGCLSTSGATSNQVETMLTLPAGTYTLVVASPDASNAGKFLKLWAGGDGLTTLSVSTSGGLVSPQTMATGVLTVGAVNGSDGLGNTLEYFSSTGPLTIVFPTFTQVQAPSLVAPDGIVVDAQGTYFAGELFPDGNFYGTSAAVPNAAGVAALLRSAFPTLSAPQITTALQAGATVLGATSPDDMFGYGRVDALGALATLPGPTMTALTDASSSGSASTMTQPFTVTGTGPLHFSVSSSNTALVPNSVVASGTPGVTVSAGCGTSTLNCTLLVTPQLGQSGTATLTVSALDGAGRPAVTQLVFTATDPAPAPPSSGSGGGSSTLGGGSGTAAPSGHGGGGALQVWALLFLAALTLWSKIQREFQYSRERFQRMHLNAIHSLGRFTR